VTSGGEDATLDAGLAVAQSRPQRTSIRAQLADDEIKGRPDKVTEDEA